MINLQHSAKGIDTKYQISGSQTTITIGTGTYTGQVSIYDFSVTLPSGSESGFIEIRRFSSLADRISIHLFGDHDYKQVCMNPLVPVIKDYKELVQPVRQGESVIIGNDVWIGNHVTILSNVEIGDGAVIGACAVVSRNIPPYAIAVGNPIRIIGYRFDEEIISALLRVRWWDWSDEKIKANVELLFSRDIRRFIDLHG